MLFFFSLFIAFIFFSFFLLLYNLFSLVLFSLFMFISLFSRYPSCLFLLILFFFCICFLFWFTSHSFFCCFPSSFSCLSYFLTVQYSDSLHLHFSVAFFFPFLVYLGFFCTCLQFKFTSHSFFCGFLSSFSCLSVFLKVFYLLLFCSDLFVIPFSVALSLLFLSFLSFLL